MVVVMTIEMMKMKIRMKMMVMMSGVKDEDNSDDSTEMMISISQQSISTYLSIYLTICLSIYISIYLSSTYIPELHHSRMSLRELILSFVRGPMLFRSIELTLMLLFALPINVLVVVWYRPPPLLPPVSLSPSSS